MSGPTLGLIVNPIAGMGGRVGLKGTDGAVAQARALNAEPLSETRATQALAVVAAQMPDLTVVTAPGSMGEDVARALGWAPRVIGSRPHRETTAADTRHIATALADIGVDVLVFAGGDGTARDICGVIGTNIPAIGIPTGVKMHSAVYATSPRAAGEVVVRALAKSATPTREAEVMDIDEESFRAGLVSAKLYGYMRVPVARGLVQGLKSGRGGGEPAELAAIAADVAQRLPADRLTIFGPGTTTRAITDHIGVTSTLLGVDILYRGEMVARDATEREILDHLSHAPGTVIVTPIGGQGFIFGRGNQQLSNLVLRRVGLENIIIVATPSKLTQLAGEPLRVDTGDDDLDALMGGYRRVVTGYGMETVYPVAS